MDRTASRQSQLYYVLRLKKEGTPFDSESLHPGQKQKNGDYFTASFSPLPASKKLPKTLDKAKLEGAKADYEAAAKMWDETKSTFSGGNMADAIAKAKTVKEKAREVINQPRHQ